MKRKFCLILALALIVSLATACVKEETAPVPVETQEDIRNQLGIREEEQKEASGEKPAETPTQAPTQKPTEAPTETPTEAPTEAPAPAEPPTEAPTEPETVTYVNPLTGEETEKDLTLNRPYAIMLDNVPDAVPQDGVSAADILFEATVEGQPTRAMGIFLDITQVEKIGAIRSARGNFVDLAAPFDPFYAHAGGSDEGLKEIRKVGIVDLNVENGNVYEYFPRDTWRSNNLGYVHSIVAMTEEVVTKVPEALGVSATREEPLDYGYRFTAEPKLPDTAEKAAGKVVILLGYKNTEFVYDQENNVYLASQYSSEWIDHNADNKQLSFRNVVALYMKSYWYDSHRLYYSTGEGTGTLIVDGKAVAIRWSRETVKDPLQLTYEDGSPVELGVGKTYIGIITDQGYVYYD